MNFHLLIVIILFSLGNAADNYEDQTQDRPASQADSALTGTLAEVEKNAPVYVKGEGIAVKSSYGCDFVEVVNTREHESREGVYQKTSATCDGKPIWQKMAGFDRTNIEYLYFMSVWSSNYASWYHGPSPCSSTVYAYARSSADRPGDANGWMEVSTNSNNFQASPMRVTCKAGSPCSRMFVKNVPSVHSEKEGEYQRYGTCSYRPAYRMGNNYLYYFIGTSYSGWVITSDACTRSTVSVNMRNVDNTGYPQDAEATWQYYSFSWRSSSYMAVDCNAYAPYENWNGSARGIPHASVTVLAVMIAYFLGRCSIKEA